MNQRGQTDAGWLIAGIVLLVVVVGLALLGGPIYGVWASEQNGKAQLAQATYSKQIAVQEAQAKMDSAKLLADAEIERAKGVAQANEIIGDSLKNNEEYLRYLYINGISENPEKQVIYIPTEAGLPILEAGKRGE